MIGANKTASATITQAANLFLFSRSRHVDNGTKAANTRAMVMKTVPNVSRSAADSSMEIATA